jgi:hypothetical protein
MYDGRHQVPEGKKGLDRMKEEIEKAVSVLVGLPLLSRGRAINMTTFGFGKPVTRLDRHEKPVDVPQYCLHVQCHWRIVEQHPKPRIVAGSRDLHYPADPTIDPEDETFHYDEPGVNLCDYRMRSFMDTHKHCPLIVESIEADEIGSLRIHFTGDFFLDLFPDTTLRDEFDEHWCLSSYPDQSTFHVTGSETKPCRLNPYQ